MGSDASFEALGLSKEVLQAVTDAGYSDPTPIQQQAIPFVLMARDLLGIAQTGTGKTASFTLPMIDILSSGRAKARMPRALILEPTRELADQVAENFDKYGKYTQLSKALLIGGVSFGDQEKLIDRGVDVLIATPGRLLDHWERGKVLLPDVKILVVDEADRMLDMGFIPDVERIVKLLPPIRQTLFFSATMPREIRRLADAFLTNPKEIQVAPPASPAETVQQHLVNVSSRDKRAALRRLIDDEAIESCLVFCNRKREVSTLSESLRRYGYDVAALHGDIPQPVRLETMDRFKNGEVRYLICSDVAARGIDIRELPVVINYDVPFNPEDYVHRIGRTGRAGKSGRAFTLATGDDAKLVRAIETMLGKPIPRFEVAGATRAATPEDDGASGKTDKRRGGRRSKSRDKAAEPAPAAVADDRTRARKPTPAPKPAEARERGAPGLGDHVPAFLMQPLPRRFERSGSSDESTQESRAPRKQAKIA